MKSYHKVSCHGLAVVIGFALLGACNSGEKCEGDGVLRDPTSGLCWQNPASFEQISFYEALDYCQALDLGEHGAGSWQMPTMNELRSLIRGCPETETGGACGFTDSSGECNDPSCEGCSDRGGPGVGGTYWPAEFGGPVSCSGGRYGCPSWYWADSGAIIVFTSGEIGCGAGKIGTPYVRCVRRGP